MSISHQNKNTPLLWGGGVLVVGLVALTALALGRITTGSFLTSYFKTRTIGIIVAGTAGGSALIATSMLIWLYKQPSRQPHSGSVDSRQPGQPLTEEGFQPLSSPQSKALPRERAHPRPGSAVASQAPPLPSTHSRDAVSAWVTFWESLEIGRASCRERV